MSILDPQMPRNAGVPGTLVGVVKPRFAWRGERYLLPLLGQQKVVIKRCDRHAVAQPAVPELGLRQRLGLEIFQIGMD